LDRLGLRIAHLPAVVAILGFGSSAHLSLAHLMAFGGIIAEVKAQVLRGFGFLVRE
jgi:hypothetical protein